MKSGDVRVLGASVKVVADDNAAAITFLRTAERALAGALEGLADGLGDEVLVVRELALRGSALSSAGRASVEEVRSALHAHLGARLAELRARGGSDGDVAWYPSAAAALGAYLRALAQGDAGAWPHRVFAVHGSDWGEVLRGCLRDGRAPVGDLLAELARLSLAGQLATRIDGALAASLLALWTEGDDAAAVDWLAFPAEVREGLAAGAGADLRAAGDGTAGPAHGQLILLAHLFAAWPPARGLHFRAGDLAAAAANGGRAPGPGAGRLASRAGGLVFWARVAADSGLDGALDDGYPQLRAQRAARWALGRALESGSLDARDPLLLLWCGEAPGTAAFPSFGLDGADPEPLHAAAVRLALRLGDGARALRVVPFGGGVAVLAERDVVVDWLPLSDPHDALADIVRRFSARAGQGPASVEVRDGLTTADLDAVAEIDAPAVADAWRPALWAAASLLRAAAAVRWGARLRDVRDWPAAVLAEAPAPTIELPRGTAGAVAAGTWVAPSITLAGREHRLIIT